MTPLLENRSAVVTAAGSGMGRAAALRLAEHGATVVAADIDRDAVKAVAAAADALPGTGKVIPYELDVTDIPAMEEMFRYIEKEFDGLNVLFNHAGIPGPAGLDVDVESWARVTDLNVRSAVFATKWSRDDVNR